MTAPGVGALVSVTFRTAPDEPSRFSSSETVGAYFGLTPKRYQSGETDVTGGISKVGDAIEIHVEGRLFRPAMVMRRPT
jgi:transposase